MTRSVPRLFPRSCLALLLAAGAWLCASAAHADAMLTEDGSLQAYGDARLRLESDFDSVNGEGERVDDRTRFRIRTRLGLRYIPDEAVQFNIRARTGDRESHQSPHITFADASGGESDEVDGSIDQWFAQARKDGFWLRGGRMEPVFRGRDEFFWDDDATLLGIAGGIHRRFAPFGDVALTFGHFALPVGMTEFSGRMSTADLLVVHELAPNWFIHLGTGYTELRADREDPDAQRLILGNGLRDYRLWNAHLRLRHDWNGLPVWVQGDYVHNGEPYSAADPDPYTATHHDDKDGYILSLNLGGLDREGQWYAAYHYAYVEALAHNASYGQDDWLRWGGDGQVRMADFQGHQVSVGYALTDSVNLLARLFLVEGISSHQEQTNRFRLDMNYRF